MYFIYGMGSTPRLTYSSNTEKGPLNLHFWVPIGTHKLKVVPEQQQEEEENGDKEPDLAVL
jgi:hypothetical protein